MSRNWGWPVGRASDSAYSVVRLLTAAALAVVLFASLVPTSNAQVPERTTSGSTYVEVTETQVTIGNALVERVWSRAGWSTQTFTDKRSPEGVGGAVGPDFTLDVGATGIGSDSFEATSVAVEEIADGLRAEVTLSPLAGAEPAFDVTRVIEIYDGIAGMKTQTVINTPAPLVLRGYALEQAAVGDDVTATTHAFRAGADWREPDWAGPCDGSCSLGDPHAGTWRDSDTAATGEDISGPAQWISAERDGHSMFMVMERNDWPSSRAEYEAGTLRLQVDYSADVIILGPLEESGHVENPAAGDAPGRHRVIEPGAPYELESVFVGFGSDPDDEPWQFYKYLSEQRLAGYSNDVTFNSNGTDANVRSDGAKDDMTEDVILETAPLAKRLGIETFILDDGWQARSGDWEPDCGTEPGAMNTDPRWDGTPATDKFRPRYSDCTFAAVKDAIAPMELGLWMSPMHYHPRSATYGSSPNWGCAPVGHAVGATSLVQPSGGSNDAGLGTWGPDPGLMAHIESRIQNAIDNWGVEYFKFDFLVWLDCVGQGDMYDYKEAFIAMLDRLIERNPSVTFEIDETNDYRLFPFDSVTRGPSWFQNGSPSPDRLLHNIWNLAPYIPTYSLGQHFLGGNQYQNYPVDTLMAGALPSHLTFFSDLRRIPTSVLDEARPWLDFYKENRDNFIQMTYPLLSDPLDKQWTALQTWNPEEGKGALLAFRQESDAATKSIALRNVPANMTFDLFEAPTGTKVGTVTSAQLRQGLEVTIPQVNGASVLVIEPASANPFDPTTTLTYDGDTSVKLGGALKLGATLRGDDGPISGAQLTFQFRGQTFTATTDGSGRATVAGARTSGPPGTYEAIVRYAGSARYEPSETRASIRVGR